MMVQAVDRSLRQLFLDGMSQAAATVNIVTTDGVAGRHGVTVSAMASVSADSDPPTMLVCVSKQSSAAEPMRANGVFHVNVLRNSQANLSDTFAGRNRTAQPDKFSSAEWVVEKTGAPRILDPLAAFDCRVVQVQEIGTHYVFVGAVENVFLGEPGLPLIYAHRTYGTPTLFQTEPQLGKANKALRIGTFHTIGPIVVPKVLQHLATGRRFDLKLVDGDQQFILEHLRQGGIDMALIYDWDLEPSIIKERFIGLRPYALFGARDALAGREKVSLAELVGRPMVLLDAPPSETFFLSLFTARGLEPTIGYRTRSLEMLRGLVGSGLGYAILVAPIASTMAYGGQPLAKVPLADANDVRHITLAFKADRELGQDADLFRSACRFVLSSAELHADR